MEILTKNHTIDNTNSVKFQNSFTYDDIAAKIAGSHLDYKESHDSIRCQCPAHGGEKLSLSIRRTADGGFSAKCFSHNCDFKDILVALVGNSSPSTPARPLHRPKLRPTSELKPFYSSAEIIAIYPYKSSHDVTMFQKLRMETHNPDGSRKQYKTASGRMIDTPKYVARHQVDGIWYHGKGNCTPLLYNAPELESAETVYICEGEKDADNLNAGLKELGLFGRIVATTNHDGAGGNWRAEYTQQLSGKTIVIYPDMNDSERQGEEHAQKVASALYAHCPSIHIVELPNDGEKGFDVSDYLAINPFSNLYDLTTYVTESIPAFAPVQSSADGKIIYLDEKNGIYLNDVMTSFENLPQHCSLTSFTGSRKTTTAIKLINELGFGIYVTSGVLATRAIAEKEAVNGWGVWYQGEKRLAKKIVCTYDSLPAVIREAADAGYDFSKIPLIIDESHNFAIADYRLDALKKVSSIVNSVQFKNVLLLSGTPLPIWSPAFKRFEEVKVASYKRIQRVQLVNYHKEIIDENGKVKIVGTMINALVTLALMHLERNERVLIRLDSKGSLLDSLIARLIEGGIKPKTIFTLNADNKLEGFGQLLATQETVPPELRVMIVTATFVESSNLLSDFGTIISHTGIHPAMNEQLFNRKRGEAVPICYLLNGGLGRGFMFDRDKEREMVGTWLAATCALINARQDDDLAESDVRLFARDYSNALTKNTDDRWEICPLGLTQLVYESETLYFAQNPIAYIQWVNNHSGYRWQWLPQTTIAIENKDLPKGVMSGALEIKTAISDFRKAQYRSVCEWLASLQESERAAHEAQKLDGLSRRLVDRAIKLDFELFERGESADTWHDAVMLLYSLGKDSTAQFNRLMRQIELDKAKREGNPLFDMIVDAFQGKTMNQEKRHATLLGLYREIPKLEVFTHEVFLRYWSAEKKPLLTPKMADDLLQCIFDVSKSRESAEGGRARVWTFGTALELQVLIAEANKLTFSNESTRRPVVATDVHWQLDSTTTTTTTATTSADVMTTTTDNLSTKITIIKENNKLCDHFCPPSTPSADSSWEEGFIGHYTFIEPIGDVPDVDAPDGLLGGDDNWSAIDTLNDLLRSQADNLATKITIIKENNKLCDHFCPPDGDVPDVDALDGDVLGGDDSDIDAYEEYLRWLKSSDHDDLQDLYYESADEEVENEYL